MLLPLGLWIEGRMRMGITMLVSATIILSSVRHAVADTRELESARLLKG